MGVDEAASAQAKREPVGLLSQFIKGVFNALSQRNGGGPVERIRLEGQHCLLPVPGQQTLGRFNPSGVLQGPCFQGLPRRLITVVDTVHQGVQRRVVQSSLLEHVPHTVGKAADIVSLCEHFGGHCPSHQAIRTHDIAVNDHVQRRATGAEGVADEQEILNHGHAVVQLVALLKGDIQLLESTDHRQQKNNGQHTDQRRALGKVAHLRGKRSNLNFAGLFQREAFWRQHQHQCGEGGDAQEIDEKQANGDDRTKHLKESKRGQAEGEKSDDIGGDGNQQGNRRQRGSLADGALARCAIKVPKRDAPLRGACFVFLEFLPDAQDNVQTVVNPDGQQQHWN